jgi:site-specific recombinase XerD
MADVPAPRLPKRVPRIYSEEQLQSVLKIIADKPRERAIIELFLDSGIRLSELIGLHVEALDLVQGTVRVMGKGGKERYSYFSPKTALALNNYIEKRPSPTGNNYLFLTANGDQLGKSGVQSLLQRVGEKASLPVRLTPHNLRHTYATLCLRNGSNLEYIRITLGHSDIKTTSEAYLAATQQDVALAYRKFSPVANLNKQRK